MTAAHTDDPEITDMHRELGIPENYAQTCGLVYHPECRTLVETEADVFGRQPYLDTSAFTAWQAMQEKAQDDGITLQIVSAYRSARYQMELLQKKLARGDTIEDVLQVNAAPGFSEHHSGCALDITTPGFEPLEEEFEHSPAFNWLCRHGGKFGFSMSFPRDNPTGMAYEPWHWKFNPANCDGENQL